MSETVRGGGSETEGEYYVIYCILGMLPRLS